MKRSASPPAARTPFEQVQDRQFAPKPGRPIPLRPQRRQQARPASSPRVQPRGIVLMSAGASAVLATKITCALAISLAGGATGGMFSGAEARHP